MEYRQFGRTGLDVSAIGFGCWQISGGYGHVEEAEFSRAVARALDLGINCFDTAEVYGTVPSRPKGLAHDLHRQQEPGTPQVRRRLGVAR